MKYPMLSMLLSISALAATTALAQEAVPVGERNKAVVIVFNPPKGMEKEFFETFATDQAANFKKYSKSDRSQTESINLIPNKMGEPLIHITILKNGSVLDEAYKGFGPEYKRGAYVGKHSEKYGDLKIPKQYLQNSQSYFADVIR